MKKMIIHRISIILITALVFLAMTAGGAAALDLSGSGVDSAILVEAETGEVLYEKQADKEHSPASLTKLMTVLLAMEDIEDGSLELDDMITVSEYASSMGGSQIYLGEGDLLKVRELLKAIMVASANDASVALAEAIAGDVDLFIERMNQRAEELGMENTNFTTVHGLPHEDQYTTASDLVRLSRELLQYPQVLEWSQIWTETLQLPEREAMLVNTNKLILSYPELDGLKTGFTRSSGYNLAATARQGDMRLISIVLGADTEYFRREITTDLLDYGFDNYELKEIFAGGDQIEGIEIEEGHPREISARLSGSLYVPVNISGDEETDYRLDLKEEIAFPLQPGEKIGELHSFAGDEKMHSRDLLAEKEVVQAGIFRRFLYTISDWLR